MKKKIMSLLLVFAIVASLGNYQAMADG